MIQVAITYAIIGAGVTEAASNLLGPLGAPAFVQTGIAVIVLLGFPVTVTLSWFVDITRGRAHQAGDTTGTGRAGAEAIRVAAPARERPEGSIAAIPFVNLSGDPAQDYLSDGLTEELIVALSRVKDLHVASRTSCFAVRNSEQDIREIGHRLGVRNIVEGSVRLAGRRLRLSVQLVEVDTGYSLWTETYERELDDIFTVQAEIAQQIAERVTRSTTAATQRIVAPGTQSVDAFQQYLRGRFHWNRRTETDLRLAITEFESAVATDPQYAAAYAGLADAWSLLLDYGGVAPGVGLGPARDAAERALELDPDLAEAWTSLALVREFEYRWADAETAFRKSIAMRPDYAVAHQRFALHLAWTGRDDEAVREARTAEQLDPLSVAVGASTGFVLYYARRFDDAVKQLKRTIAADPNFATAHVALGLALLQMGNSAGAVHHLEIAAMRSGRAASALCGLACALAHAGNREAADSVIAEIERKGDAEWVASYPLAVAHIGVGDLSTALDLLEDACAEGVPQMIYLAREPLLDPLRDSPRFQALLARVNLAGD